MARKTTTPQPLTLPNPNLVDDDLDFIGSPKTPLSPKSPRSPRSPFRFSSKRTQSELPSMQAAESQQTRSAALSSSHTTPSLSAISHYSVGEEQQQQQPQQQKQERPARSGFFSNYKASKSSSRLQNNQGPANQPDDRMSRDTDRPAMSGRVSSKENTRAGKTLPVSTTWDERKECYANHYFANRIQSRSVGCEKSCWRAIKFGRVSRLEQRVTTSVHEHDCREKEQAEAF